MSSVWLTESAALRMFAIASRMTIITSASLLVRRSQSGGITPQNTSNEICSIVPPAVRFVTAHTASFWALKSPPERIFIIKGMIPSSMTACICETRPCMARIRKK